MKSRKISIITIVGSLFLFACQPNESVVPDGGNNPQIATVKVNAISFEGGSSELEGEKEIKDMQACVFSEGVMTQVFKGLGNKNGEYHLQMDNLTGKLYMFANLVGKLDLDAMLTDKVAEDEFLLTTVEMGSDEKSVHFFTGMIDLQASDNYSYTVDVVRGVARFDLLVSSRQQEISVKKLELTNIAQKTYLITPSDGIATPDMASRTNVAITFDVPIKDNKHGFLYVYEQVNENIQVKVTLDVAGKEKLLTKTISGDITRNTIYTIKVNKDNIDIDINVNIKDWEDGVDTEIEA